MQPQSANPLSDKDKAYIKMLELHFSQTAALLSDIAGSPVGAPLVYRELENSLVRLEEGFLHAREFILRRHLNKAKVN